MLSGPARAGTGVSTPTSCAGQSSTWGPWRDRPSEPCLYGWDFLYPNHQPDLVFLFLVSHSPLIPPVWPELGMGGQSSMEESRVLEGGPAHPHPQLPQKRGSW